jgi:hypothetical protein
VPRVVTDDDGGVGERDDATRHRIVGARAAATGHHGWPSHREHRVTRGTCAIDGAHRFFG